MTKLYETDYVLVDKKTKKPVEDYCYIYHYTSVIDAFNTLVDDDWEYISMSELDKSEQLKYEEELKKVEKMEQKYERINNR